MFGLLLELQERIIGLVHVTKIGRTTIGEFLIVVLYLILLILFLLLALEKLFHTGQLFRAAKVSVVSHTLSEGAKSREQKRKCWAGEGQ